MITRLGVLIAVGLIGVIAGLIGRWVTSRPHGAATGSPVDNLSPGLYIFTAPYCAACTHLRHRLDNWRPEINYRTVDVTERPELIRALDIRTAPTLVAIDNARKVRARLHGSVTDEQLAEAIDIART